MKEIAVKLLDWHKNIHRDLPWKSTGDPYFIWLSEVIMQQTRVAQGTPYYLKFIELFPTVADLANASQEEVFKAWEGLGYYSRARNLHAAAKYIDRELEGVFPTTYDDIIKLPGVGPYTAAAISSFAFQEDKAVLDGNVFRVLSRLFNIETDILSSKGKKEFGLIAEELLPQGYSGEYNQAIMDFGALLCTPQNPSCMFCPLVEECAALSKGIVSKRPVKKKAKKKVIRYLHFLDTRELGYTLIEKREMEDVWKGLHQFPIVESKKESNVEMSEWEDLTGLDLSDFSLVSIELKQLLSHQDIRAKFVKLNKEKRTNASEPAQANFRYKQVKNIELGSFSFPRIINMYLDKR